MVKWTSDKLGMELIDRLETSLKDESLFLEYLHLHEIDCIKEEEEDPYEKFINKLKAQGEEEFLKILEKNELI